MAAFVGAGALAGNATVAPQAISSHVSTAVGDILICQLINKSVTSNPVSPPDGTWTKLVEATNNSTTAAHRHQYTLFWKVATLTGAQSYTFTKTSDDNVLFAGVISTWKAVGLDATALGATVTTAASDNVSFPAFDPTSTSAHVLYFAWYGLNATTFGTMSGTNPTCTTRYDLESATGTFCTLACTSGESTGSAITSRTWASASTTDAGNTGVVIAFNNIETVTVTQATVTVAGQTVTIDADVAPPIPFTWSRSRLDVRQTLIYRPLTIPPRPGAVTDTVPVTQATVTYTGKAVGLIETGSAGATLVFQQAVSQGGSPTSLAFTVASAAGQERLVALCAIGTESPPATFASVSVDGQTAAQVGSLVRQNDHNGSDAIVSFWRAAGTANTAINVTFTPTGPYDARGAVWTLSNAGALLDYTAGTINSPSSGNNLSLDIDTVAGGAVAAVFLAYNSSAKNASWVGLTESYEGGTLYSGDWSSAANLDTATASTPLTVTAVMPTDWTGLGAVAGLAVSFNPAAAAPETVTVTQATVTFTGQTVSIGDATPPGTNDVFFAATTTTLRVRRSLIYRPLTTTVRFAAPDTTSITPATVVFTGKSVTDFDTAPVLFATTRTTRIARRVLLYRSLTPLVRLPAVTDTVTVTQAAVTYTGKTVTLVDLEITPVLKASVTVAGKTVTVRESEVTPVTPAAVVFTGKTVTVREAESTSVSKADIVVTGKAITGLELQALLKGTVTFAGQTVALVDPGVDRITVNPAAVVFTGQTVTLVDIVPTLPFAQGQTSILARWAFLYPSGTSVPLVTAPGIDIIPVFPAAVLFTGKTVTIRDADVTLVAKATVLFAGKTVTVTDLVGTEIIPVNPAAIRFTGQEVTLTGQGEVQPPIGGGGGVPSWIYYGRKQRRRYRALEEIEKRLDERIKRLETETKEKQQQVAEVISQPGQIDVLSQQFANLLLQQALITQALLEAQRRAEAVRQERIQLAILAQRAAEAIDEEEAITMLLLT